MRGLVLFGKPRKDEAKAPVAGQGIGHMIDRASEVSSPSSNCSEHIVSQQHPTDYFNLSALAPVVNHRTAIRAHGTEVSDRIDLILAADFG